MPIKQIEINNINGCRLAEQGPSSGPAGVLDRETLVVIMQVLSLVSEGSGLAKIIRS